MENRFLELDHPTERSNGTGVARAQSWAKPFATTDRALVILIENGGVDLGIPLLVDKILSSVPGLGTVIPGAAKAALVKHLRDALKDWTDNLLETLDLTLGRYTAAKPDPYGDVVVLRDGTASYEDLKRTLISFSGAGKIVDLLILTHGGVDSISVRGGIDSAKIRAMKAAYGKPLMIRSVYMMNCQGSTLNQAWIDAGAKVSSGSALTNYLPEPTTYFFWSNWKAGQPFETAATGAYRRTINAINDVLRTFVTAVGGLAGAALARLINVEDMDFVLQSNPVILGQRSVTITSDSLTFTQSVGMSSSLATTVLPISVLRALSEGSGVRSAGSPGRSLSPQGVSLIKGFEGFRAAKYNDPVGHCTIGYGTLLHSGNCDGRASEQEFAQGITEAKATELLEAKAAEFQQVINTAVSVPLNQNQNDALVSFAYNVGAANFRRSTLLRVLNEGNHAAVPGELKKWTKARANGKLIDLPGLVKRREAEAALFARPVAAAGAPSSEQSLVATHTYESPSTATQMSGLSQMQAAPAVIAGIAVADAIQIGLGAVSVVSPMVAASQAPLVINYDKAQRMLVSEARLKMPGAQAANANYSTRLFHIGSAGLAKAEVTISWQGNAYGEIATPVVDKDLDKSTGWSHSAAQLTISRIDRIPAPGIDPRAWPIVFTYTGNYDPWANGFFEFTGEFELNAFGGLKFNRHKVVSRSTIDFTIIGQPEQYVVKGNDVIVPVPAIPQAQIDYLTGKLP